MDLSAAGAAIREDALSDAGACRCQSAAAAAAVLLLLCCCAGAAVAAAASTTTALAVLRLVTFRIRIITLELATTTVSAFYLYMQFPAPASSLAEPRPAASPQLGRWICQQGLRSAIIRGLLLVLAAASAAAATAAAAAATTIALAFFTFRTGMIVLSLHLLRLQPVRDSRHTVCLGTSS